MLHAVGGLVTAASTWVYICTQGAIALVCFLLLSQGKQQPAGCEELRLISMKSTEADPG